MQANPFYLNVLPIDAAFCGRAEELEALCRHAEANTNVVLYSPRRYGKTSLIKRVQHQLELKGFITLSVDMAGVASADDVARVLARDIFRFVNKNDKLLKKAISLITNWRPNFTPQPDGSITVSVQPASQKVGIALLEETLEGLDRFLANNPRQSNLVIDEFQEITELSQSDQIEALLRKHIQHHSTCSWFFLGSRRRLLLEMFDQQNRPFYRSSIKMALFRLPEEDAVQFVVEQFRSVGKNCPAEIAKKIVQQTAGYPYYVQRLAYEVFEVAQDEEVTNKELDEGLRRVMQEEEKLFAAIEQKLAPAQKNLLRAIAKEPTRTPYAAAYQRQHRLASQGAIQNGIKRLELLDHIEKDEAGVIRLTDPMLALWLSQQEQETIAANPAALSAQPTLSFGQTMLEQQVELSLQRGYAEKHGYRSSECIAIKARPEDSRPHFTIFLSYAHDDQNLKEQFFGLIRARLNTSKEFRYTISSDNDLLCGEQWHEGLLKRMEQCDIGLLLVSTHFLASAYIQEHEIPRLLDRCFPVLLKYVDLRRQELRGLEKLQIHHRNNKAFEDVARGNQTRFINDLVNKIDAAVSKRLEQRERESREPECHVSDQEEMALRIAKGQLNLRGDGYNQQRHIRSKAHPLCLSHQSGADASSDTVIALEYLEDWALQQDTPFFALLGDFGTGKTFTCRMLARKLNAMHDESPETVPLCIYIDLRTVSTRVGGEKKIPKLVDILQDAIESAKDPMERRNLSPQDLIRLVRQNRALIIFDGLDEKTVHFTPEETNQFIAELWSIRETRIEQNAAPLQGKMLISCRTHYFRDRIEQNTLFLGRDREGRSTSEYRSCTLLPFDEPQIREYLQKTLACDDERIAQITDMLEEVHNLKELASRPYTLSLMTEFIPDLEARAASGQTINTSTLYETIVNNWLARDEGKHELNRLHKKQLMKALAAEQHRRNGEPLTPDELDEWLDRWLYENPIEQSAYATTNRETLKKDLRTATCIIREENDRFSFAHTSLQEYFLAAFIIDRLTADAITPGTLAMALPSRETFDFLADILAGNERTLTTTVTALSRLLESPYSKGVSEAALAIWQTLATRGMRTPMPRRVHLEHAELSAWRIANINLANASFKGAQLRDARFSGTILRGASFDRAELVNTEFLGCNTAEADFSATDAVAAVWRHSAMQRSRWTGSELRLASFVACDLGEAVDFPTTDAPVAAHCRGITNSTLPSTGKMANYTGHASWVSSANFSNDGARIVSASFDNSVKVWDAFSGQCLLTMAHLPEHETAAWTETELKLLATSSGAWRWLGIADGCRRLPIELLDAPTVST